MKLAHNQNAEMPIRSIYSESRLLQNHQSLSGWVQMILDSIAVVAVLFLIVELHGYEIDRQYRIQAVITVLLMGIIYNSVGVYRRFAGDSIMLIRLAKCWGTVFMALMLIAFFTKSSEDYSRKVILWWAVLGYLVQVFVYLLCHFFSRRSQVNAEVIPSLVVGSGHLADHLAKSVNSNVFLPEQIVGVVDDDVEGMEGWQVDHVPALGRIAELRGIAEANRVRRIYIALPLKEASRVEEIYTGLDFTRLDVIWVPDIFSLNLLHPRVREVAGMPLLSLSESPITSGPQAFFKNVIDRVLSTVLLIVLSPLMLLVALAVKLTSKGPALFKQRRHGWDGQVINIYKFRSMYMHEEEDGKLTQAKNGDARVTPLGRFLRRTSIDELPQLYNVLQGKMSLTGPRPHAVQHNDYYAEKIHAYMARHRIKPGLTGLAQINGCRGETETVEDMQRRVEFDLSYINDWSLKMDMVILLKTPFALLFNKAY
ncbi:MAG: undecaprenyl-phosphate glucose phosphotransferase [Pseudomonadales bacterium]